MSTTKEKAQILVWTKTERAGDIVTVDKTEGDFTFFTDGSRVFTNVLDEVTISAPNETQAESLSKPFKNTNVTEPQRNPEPVVDNKTTTQASGEINVMLEMLKKISAKNTITMPLELNVPSKDVYDLFKDQMDITKADLNEQILALVLSQINNLQEQLKPQAEEFIKNYYNVRRNNTKSTGSTESTNTGTASGPDITY